MEKKEGTLFGDDQDKETINKETIREMVEENSCRCGTQFVTPLKKRLLEVYMENIWQPMNH